MNIFNYARLCRSDKEAMLRNHALFIEHYQDGENAVCVYFLNGFFVEVTVEDGLATSYIPFRRGYMLRRAVTGNERVSIAFKQVVKVAPSKRSRARSSRKK